MLSIQWGIIQFYRIAQFCRKRASSFFFPITCWWTMWYVNLHTIYTFTDCKSVRNARIAFLLFLKCVCVCFQHFWSSEQTPRLWGSFLSHWSQWVLLYWFPQREGWIAQNAALGLPLCYFPSTGRGMMWVRAEWVVWKHQLRHWF